MPSELQRVTQELLDALNEIERIVPYLHDRAQKYRQAAGWVGSTSHNQSARTAAMQLDEAARRCEEAAHFLTQTRQPGIQWVQQMVGGIRTTGPSSGSAGPQPPGPGDSTPPAERRRDDDTVDPRADEPDSGPGTGDASSPDEERAAPLGMSVEDVRRIFGRLPVRGPGDKTRGVWRDSDGGEHDLTSGQHEGDFHAAQRHAERLGLVRVPHKLSTAADVELKFAMRMRREGIRYAEIILNNRPCGGRLGCDRLLKLFLPPGASLTVYGPDGFKKTYPERDQE